MVDNFAVVGNVTHDQIHKGEIEMTCAFCDELESPNKMSLEIGFNRIIWEDEDFVVLPTVGCFVEGYVMLMPKEHSYSFAQLDALSIARADYLTKKLRRELEDIYGEYYEDTPADSILVAEHGAVSCAIKGAQCCDHAHLHFIPLATEARLFAVFDEYLKAANGANRIPVSSLMDAKRLGAAEHAYILASFDPSHFMVWLSSNGFRSQFCRWASAKLLGIEEQYSWKTHPHFENMKKTCKKLKGLTL